MDKKLDTTTVDLIFADNRVKPRGMNRIDFYQFEIALELVAEKKVLPKIEVRTAMITQGTPKTVATSTKPTLKVKKVDNARLISEKRIAAILRRSPRELGKDSWKKEVDNKEAQLNLSTFFFLKVFCNVPRQPRRLTQVGVWARLRKLLGGCHLNLFVLSTKGYHFKTLNIPQVFLLRSKSCLTNWTIQGSMEGVWLGFQSWTHTQTCL